MEIACVRHRTMKARLKKVGEMDWRILLALELAATSTPEPKFRLLVWITFLKEKIEKIGSKNPCFNGVIVFY